MFFMSIHLHKSIPNGGMGMRLPPLSRTNQAAFCATGENCVTGSDYVIGIMPFGSLLNMH